MRKIYRIPATSPCYFTEDRVYGNGHICLKPPSLGYRVCTRLSSRLRVGACPLSLQSLCRWRLAVGIRKIGLGTSHIGHYRPLMFHGHPLPHPPPAVSSPEISRHSSIENDRIMSDAAKNCFSSLSSFVNSASLLPHDAIHSFIHRLLRRSSISEKKHKTKTYKITDRQKSRRGFDANVLIDANQQKPTHRASFFRIQCDS